jgi:hypothetical protein
MPTLQAPFPWFGGKSRVADIVWERFGRVANYVEPFAGSLAVLLAAPRVPTCETVNDADGFLCNFWRAVTAEPDAVASHADWPVNENDLHARHAVIAEMRADFTRRLEGDPEYYDAKIAGWWVWGICCWINGGFGVLQGPWCRVDGKLIKSDAGRGVIRQRVHLGSSGQGVKRQRVHLGEWFGALSERLRRVRVCCGDWSRVLGPSPTTKLGTTAVFLDPPYGDVRAPDLYGEDSLTIAADVAAWCAEHGSDPDLRIALCGYEGEHDLPDWTKHSWDTGSASFGNTSGHRERIWFSPSCQGPRQQQLWG